MKPKFMVGTSVPNFEASILDGSPFTLNQYNDNKLLLIDFWGSWCAPCRKANPELVKLYNEFNGQNFKDFEDFEIVSIAIETNEKSWKNAITQDKLRWNTHIVQLDRFSSPIAKLYGVKEIPTTYMVNPQGKILGVNMTYEEMKNLLSSKLASK